MTPREEVEYVMKTHEATTKLAEYLTAQSNKFKSMFVDWDMSKRLKAVGFDEPCFAYFWTTKDTFHYTVRYENHNTTVARVSAPLIHQVIDWFDSKKIYIDIDHALGNDWEFTISNGGITSDADDRSFDTRHKAMLAAIDTALKIVENGYTSGTLNK